MMNRYDAEGCYPQEEITCPICGRVEVLSREKADLYGVDTNQVCDDCYDELKGECKLMNRYDENKVIDLPVKMLANAVRLQFEGECDDKQAAPIYFSGFAAALRMLGKDALADEILGAAAAEKLL